MFNICQEVCEKYGEQIIRQYENMLVLTRVLWLFIGLIVGLLIGVSVAVFEKKGE